MKPTASDPSIAKLSNIINSYIVVTEDSFREAADFVKTLTDPLTFLADFSEVHPGYEVTIPQLFLLVCCKGNRDLYDNALSRTANISNGTELCSTNGMPDRLCHYKIFRPKGKWTFYVDDLRETYRLLQPIPAPTLGEVLKAMFDPTTTPTVVNQKENTMITTSALSMFRQLAKKDTTTDDVTALVGKISPDLESALKELQVNEDKAKAQSDAKIIFDLLKNVQNSIDTRVAALRNLRKSADAEKAKILSLDTARAYALETKNFLPLVTLVEGTLAGISAEESTIPEGWTPAPTTVA